LFLLAVFEGRKGKKPKTPKQHPHQEEKNLSTAKMTIFVSSSDRAFMDLCLLLLLLLQSFSSFPTKLLYFFFFFFFSVFLSLFVFYFYCVITHPTLLSYIFVLVLFLEILERV